ncbi:hypothetical protein [Thalassobaculum litoreum]|nr:hypothetical protein [Thalassobaculum litoreum]
MMPPRRPVGGLGLTLDDAARATAILLAGLSGALALGVGLTGDRVSALVARTERVVGPVFLAALLLLTLIALIAVVRLWRDPGDRSWHIVGLQASAGIATLALTFTLLGIGLGIASLSTAALGPETAGRLVGALTRRFAMAFATSIVGLPLAALLRAVLLVLAAREPDRAVPDGEAPGPGEAT